MFAGLSLDQAPPYKAPIKFFITAPVFAILSGIFVFLSNDYTAHSPYIIATIHLLTIGFILMIILGALQQMLPVVAGAVIPKAKLTANITYFSLVFGLVFFVSAFLTYQKIFFFLSAIFLLVGILYFTIIALVQLFKVTNKSFIVIGIVISLLFLIASFLIGIHLLIGNSTGNIASSYYDFANLHYNYIFFGFVFILIVSITIQVVPMFWVTSSYKTRDQALMIFIPTILLLLYALNIVYQLEYEIFYKLFLGAVICFFLVTTLNKLKNRKRKLQDITVNFYNTSMIFLFIATVYWILMSFINLPIAPLVILFGLGFIVSLINGMLYKIVPFLTWFHLNAQGVFTIPTMRDMIAIPKMQEQYFFHLCSVVLFIVGFLLNISFVIKLASIFFIISNILFFSNLYNTIRIYKNNNEGN